MISDNLIPLIASKQYYAFDLAWLKAFPLAPAGNG